MNVPTGNGRTIVLAEDDVEARSYLETALLAQGYDVRVAEDGEEALRCIDMEPGGASLLLMDVIMPRMDGIEALHEVRRRYGQFPVILYSGDAANLEIDTILEKGWARFMEKPFHHEALIREIESILGKCSQVPQTRPWFNLLENPYMKQMDALLRQVSGSDVPVLLHGETGVGKEVMARQIHSYSRRANKPFVKVNCAALPSELVESELFGYERGAFTGAVRDRPGRFELAQGGTILLDEIGDMDVRLQAKLLQVLQDSEFHRLGSRELVRVDVRVMAATHQDLRKAIREGRFREDLYYRLNVINIQIPPIRRRKGELLCLAQSLLEKHASPGHPPLALPPALQQAMLEYDWPGNIRELENTMRRYLVVRDAAYMIEELTNLTASQAPKPAKDGEKAAAEANGTGLKVPASALQEAERQKREAERVALMKALEANHWNRKQAAVMLNIDYKAFLYKMKKLGIGHAPRKGKH